MSVNRVTSQRAIIGLSTGTVSLLPRPGTHHPKEPFSEGVSGACREHCQIPVEGLSKPRLDNWPHPPVAFPKWAWFLHSVAVDNPISRSFTIYGPQKVPARY